MKGLIRDVMILILPESRTILSVLIGFISSFCEKVTVRSRNSWVKQLCTILGSNLQEGSSLFVNNETTPTKKSHSPPSWKCLFLELMVQANGFHSESMYNSEAKDIWIIDAHFAKEIEKRYQIMKTPSKRTTVYTPIRKGVVRGMQGSALKRNLFSKTVKTSLGNILEVDI